MKRERSGGVWILIVALAHVEGGAGIEAYQTAETLREILMIAESLKGTRTIFINEERHGELLLLSEDCLQK